MKVAICDDNEDDILYFSEKIRESAQNHGIIVEIKNYTSIEQLRFALSDAGDAPDVLFLDINMPGLNGIDLAEELRMQGFHNNIVFLTISDKYMLQAFDVGAFNYIIKKRTPEKRFDRVVVSALRSAKKKASAYLFLSAGGENRNIPIDEIKYFEVINRIIHVHYGDESFEFFSTMGKLENRLSKYGFIRIHRSFLVAKAYIESFSYTEVILTGGERLPLSRKMYNVLKKELEEQL